MLASGFKLDVLKSVRTSLVPSVAMAAAGAMVMATAATLATLALKESLAAIISIV